jgi:hypothetical protein
MKKGTTSSYDPALTQIIINGALMFGFSDGKKINVASTTDLWTMFTGSDDFTLRLRQNDASGLITLSLMQSSPCNDILTGFVLIDTMTPGGRPFPVLIKDLLGTTLITASTAWIQKLPDIVYSKDHEAREWAIACADLSIFLGGNTQFGV